MRISKSRAATAIVAPVALSLSLSGAALVAGATSASADDAATASSTSQVAVEQAKAAKIPATLRKTTAMKLRGKVHVTSLVAMKRPVPVPKAYRKGYATGTAFVMIGKKVYKGTFTLMRKKGKLTPKRGAFVLQRGLTPRKVKGKKAKLLRATIQFVGGTKISKKRTVKFKTKPAKIRFKG